MPSSTPTEFPLGGQRIYWFARLPAGDKIRMASGPVLARQFGSISLVTDEIKYGRVMAGAFMAIDRSLSDPDGGRPGFGATLTVSQEEFDRTLVLAREGRLPDLRLEIDSAALEMGWEPDGCGKDWNDRAEGVLEVQGWDFKYPMPERDAFTEPPPAGPLPPAVADIRALGAAVDAIRSSLKLQTWVLIVAALALLRIAIR